MKNQMDENYPNKNMTASALGFIHDNPFSASRRTEYFKTSFMIDLFMNQIVKTGIDAHNQKLLDEYKQKIKDVQSTQENIKSLKWKQEHNQSAIDYLNKE